MQNEKKTSTLEALLPCSVKVSFEEALSERIREISAACCEDVQYSITSNAVKQETVFERIGEARSLDELPDLILAPGLSRVFYPEFIKRFRDTGCFRSVCQGEVSDAFKALGVNDPDGCYDIFAFNPLVFLVDGTNYPDPPVPRTWEQLLESVYERKVAFRGHSDASFCESVLLTVHRRFGDEGIEKLGKKVMCRLHPAEMAKLAGSGRENSPFVSVIPLAFTKFIKTSPKVQIIWPDDGAAVNPVVMLVKADASPAIREIGKYIAGPEVGRVLEDAGFYSICINAGSKLPTDKKYQWLGWDYIKNTDMGTLLSRLNRIMYDAIHEDDRK